MIAGFFSAVGTTVKSVEKAKTKAQLAQDQFVNSKEQAIADREALLRSLKDEIAHLAKL